MSRGRKISFTVLALSLFLNGVASAEYFEGRVEDPNEPKYVEGELLVRFAKKLDGGLPTKLERRAVLTALGGAQEAGSYWLVPGLTVVKLPDGLSVQTALTRFNARPEILYAQPNWILRALWTPNDPKFNEQWGLDNTGQTGGTAGADVNAPQAWDLAMGTREIVVAVIDSGVDYNHPDLARNMWVNEGEIPANGLDDDDNGFIDDVYGYNMIGSEPNLDDFGGVPDPCENGTGDPIDDYGHGTHCAGIIGAVTDNYTGVAGLCPNVRIMALKFLGSSGGGDTEDAISCIQYAVYMGAHITSNSYGDKNSNDPYHQALENAIEAAGEAGLLFVAAAANDTTDNDVDPVYPASYDCNNIISVLATDHHDALSYFSNYGATSVDLGAPGSSIMSTCTYGSYVNLNGTSMACPHVAGACALIWSINPALTWSEVKDIVMDSVDKLDSLDGKCVSEGRLNLHRAVLKIPRSEGFVTLDRPHYSCSDLVRITVGDSDLSGNGTLDVNIVTTDGNDLETVTLSETPADSGLFIGLIATCPNSVSPASGYLEVVDAETITVTYGQANDVAAADCTAPAVCDVQVSSVWSVAVRIAFETDEVAFARVACATDVNGPFDIIGEGAGMKEHCVQVAVLDPETTYYFKIEAFDLAGNQTTDTNDYYSFTTAASIVVPTDYASIQDAIDAAPPLETIVIEPNTYYQTFKFKGKPVTVTGTDPLDWDVVEATIIDVNAPPSAQVRGIIFDSSYLGGEAAVRGLTVKNASYGFAGSYKCHGPIVYNCIVESCSTSGIGATGATYLGHIANNIIRGNATGIGLAAGATVENNWVYQNTYGIKGPLYAGNTIVNNTIVKNSVGIQDTPSAAVGKPVISNCILWPNDTNDLLGCTATYSCIEAGFDANDPNFTGCITSDPCFVDADANDFHLSSDSLCIDAGDPNRDYWSQRDIDGAYRVVGGAVNIGADEEDCFPGDYSTYNDWVTLGRPDCWCGTPCSDGYQCDGDADGTTQDPNEYRVYDGDLELIQANWLKKINDPDLDPCADIDHKAQGVITKYRVSLNDLNIVITNWKKTDSDLDGDCPRTE